MISQTIPSLIKGFPKFCFGVDVDSLTSCFKYKHEDICIVNWLSGWCCQQDLQGVYGTEVNGTEQSYYHHQGDKSRLSGVEI